MKSKNILFIVLATAFLGIVLYLFVNATTKEENENVEYMKKYNVYALKIPKSANFAGEYAPLERWYVREAFDRELLVNTYWQSQMIMIIKRANKYFPIIEPILAEEGVPDDLKYVAVIESALMPLAVSPAKARGIWQFMARTGKEYGLEVSGDVDERYHIEKATRAAVAYFKNSYNQFGNWTMAAAAYNAGDRGIRNQAERQDASNYYDLLLNPETGRYVYRILAVKEILNNPVKYGFKVHKDDMYYSIPTRKVKVDTTITNFASWAKEQGVSYAILKDLNPWLRQNQLLNKSKRTYYIELPEEGWADFDYSNYQQ